MYKFEQEILKLNSKDDLKKGLILWIWNPVKKSPHLGISIDGSYFSLLRNAKQEAVSTDVLYNLVTRKKNSVLLINLENAEAAAEIAKVFKDYTSCEIDHCSCSKPLFDIFDILIPNGILFDILDHQKENVRTICNVGLNKDFEGISVYTFDDVLANLNTTFV